MSSRPEVVLSPIDPSTDWPALSRIKVRAFDEDPAIVLRAFPKDLRPSFEERVDNYTYLKHREEANFASRPFGPPRDVTHTIKATLASSGEIVGLAKWVVLADRTETKGELTAEEKQQQEAASKVEEERKEPREKEIEALMDGEFLKESKGEMKKRLKEVFQGKPCWYLKPVYVDPQYQGIGIGKALIAWGTNQADASSLPCYLEASPVGQPVYERLGFNAVGWSDLPGSKREQDRGTPAAEVLRWPYMLREPRKQERRPEGR